LNVNKPSILAAVVLAVASANVDAKTLYVDANTGNDAQTYAANGASAPWRSLGRAVWGSTNRSAPNGGEAARGGDVVIVRAGTYTSPGTDIRDDPSYNPANSGTASQPIVFQAEGTVVLRLSSSRGPVIGALNRNYITWRGFTINEAQAPSRPDTGPVVLAGTTGSVIEDCIIDGNGDPGYGDNHTGIRLQYTSRITLRNNRISNFLTSGVNGVNGAGIQVYFSGDVVFENNEVYNSGSGIFLKAPADDGQGTQWVDQFTIRYNRLVGNRFGIVVHRSPNTAARPTRIYQNIITDSTIGIRIWPFDAATGPMNVKIVNNTLNNNGESLNVNGDLNTNAGHIFWNNIVTNSGTYAINFGGAASNLTASRLNLEHNAYWTFGRFAILYSTDFSSLSAWKSATGQELAGSGSVNVNPLYANAAGGDFRLQAGSPVRSGGVDILDLNGNGNTSENIALGAYVVGNEVIGRRTGGEQVSSAPTAPTGLVITTQSSTE
jgi:hypothetical protein